MNDSRQFLIKYMQIRTNKIANFDINPILYFNNKDKFYLQILNSKIADLIWEEIVNTIFSNILFDKYNYLCLSTAFCPFCYFFQFCEDCFYGKEHQICLKENSDWKNISKKILSKIKNILIASFYRNLIKEIEK